MTHLLMAHTAEGNLAMAKPIIARDEEELQTKSEAFLEQSVHQGIGESVSILTEEELVLLQNLNIEEVYDAGI